MDKDEMDIDVNAIGIGCASGCGLGCLHLIIMMGILAAAGGMVMQNGRPKVPGGVAFMGFLLDLVISYFVGFITANAATHGRKLHALIVSSLTVLLGLVSLVITPVMRDNSDVWTLLKYAAVIPMGLWGAQSAIVNLERKESATRNSTTHRLD